MPLPEVEYVTEVIDGKTMVSGFVCNIHSGNARYARPIEEKDVEKCPSCGYPVCPECANMTGDIPTTAEHAAKYLASCDTGITPAYCGQCGDCGQGFMLSYLRMVGCPLPETVAKEEVTPQLVVATNLTVLPDIGEIALAALHRFQKGSRAMQTIPHATGDIIAMPDRYPNGWVLTLCRPEDR